MTDAAPMTTTIHPLGTLRSLRFVVTIARHQGKWLLCRHRDRSTWETTGGHIEPGESAEAAARRELYEESGGVPARMDALFDYAVTLADGGYNEGRVFFAELDHLDPLPASEIAEVRLFDHLPDNLTYPHITPVLFHALARRPNAPLQMAGLENQQPAPCL